MLQGSGSRPDWFDAVALVVLGVCTMAASGDLVPTRADMQSAVESRAEDPVTVLGDELEAFAGQPISNLALFRYDVASGEFVPIPFQIDQRVEHVFNPGEVFEITESMYDVFHEDDGLLDEDDELVFVFGDGGAQAPPAAPWPSGLLRPRLLPGARPRQRPAVRGALVCAGSDGTSAVRQIERIATGLRLKAVAPPLLVITHAQTPEAILAPKTIAAADLARCAGIGAAMAAGLAAGVF